MNVQEISLFIDSIAPYDTKCDWDNCGILVGDPSAKVNRIGFTLDLTMQTLRFAEENKIDLVVTHHPAIFNAQKTFTAENIAFQAAKCGINVISAHTCFDCAQGGVNDVLCSLLGIENPKPVFSKETVLPMARIGSVATTTPVELAKIVADRLNTAVTLIDAGKEIDRVAVCGGAGMSFMKDVIAAGAQAYITGEIKHNEMIEAKKNGLTVIAAGHFETEYPAMKALREKTAANFPQIECILIDQTPPSVIIDK